MKNANNSNSIEREITFLTEPHLKSKVTTLLPKKETNGLSTNNITNSPNSTNSNNNSNNNSNSNNTNSNGSGKRMKISLRDELDEMMSIAVWMDQQLKLQMEDEILALRANQKRFMKVLKERERKIEELQRENHWLRNQLDHTKVEKDSLIKRLDIESEFSQILLNIDDDDDELQSLDLIKYTRPVSATTRSKSLSNIPLAK